MPKPICDICKQPITTKERMRFKEDKHPTIWVHLGCCFDDWIEKRRLANEQLVAISNGGILK